MANDEQKSADGAGTIAKVLNQLNLPTLAMIVLMGSGNWFATKSTSDEQRTIVVRQVRDLHEALDDFEKRQKAILDNQARMLENQNRILQEIHKQP